MWKTLARRIAQRYLQAATTPLPASFSPTEPGLLTLDEYLKTKNPQGKFHETTTYDYDLAKLNREHPLNHRYTYTFLNGKYLTVPWELYQTRKGYFIQDSETKKLVAIIHKGTLYHQKWTPAYSIPTYYHDNRNNTVNLDVTRTKQVKYLQDYAHLIFTAAEKNRKKYPFVVQQIKLKGDYYQIRAEADPAKRMEGGFYPTLVVLNDKSQIVAQASDEWGATLLVVAKEYRGRGIGRVLGRYWYKIHPEQISGGYTSYGWANAKRMWADRVREFMTRGWYTELVKRGDITPEKVKAILADLSERKPIETEGKKERPRKKDLLFYIDYPTFVIYDNSFLEEPNEDGIHGFGFFRDSTPGTFLYTIDYEPKFRRLTTTVALQMARDNGEEIYVGEGYGDVLEWKGIPDVEERGDYIQLTKDALDLNRLGSLEKRIRRRVDPYDEKMTLLLEMAESKWD